MIVVVALYVVSGTLVEGGNEGVGDAVGDLDFASLLVALFLGPAWVLQAFHAPAGPGNNGGGGGRRPPPTQTPGGSGIPDLVGTTSIGPPAEIDDEIRALLDQETVRPSSH
jgi:hypothetical protein